MGHMRLAREADLVVVAPATADLLARMAAGLADDLAATALLATDKPVLVAPAMNSRMWEHPATQANLATARRARRACGSARMPARSPRARRDRAAWPSRWRSSPRSTACCRRRPPSLARAGRALVTSGPTHEPIDPVRYIANHSSGKQGHAIAAALARLGAETVLVAGPTQEPPPAGVEVVPVETAREMLAACEAALPADVAVCAAAVADWRVESAAAQKLKKDGGGPPALRLVENPDILATHSAARQPPAGAGRRLCRRDRDIVANASAKRARRRAATGSSPTTSRPATGTFGGDSNTIHLVDAEGVEDWPRHDQARGRRPPGAAHRRTILRRSAA